MKALVLEGKDQPLVLKDLPAPSPGAQEALVKIHAAALNHRDLWIQKGRYAGLKYPIIPGSDGSGIVVSTGASEDEGWIGKEVIMNPSLHWGEDQTHQDPSHFKILGLPDNGTLAEFVIVPALSLVEKPPALSHEEAAALPLAGLTAYRAVFTRGLARPGTKILITGIGGGVALFALQFCLKANADVYVSSGQQEKLDKAKALGARGGINYKDPQWVEELRKGAGAFDLIIDGAGGNDFNHLLDLAKPGGTIVSYGCTRGNPTTIEMRRIFWKQLNLLGTTMGSPADFHAMVEFIIKYKVKPVIDMRFSMQDGEAALRRMDNEHQFGKIVIEMKAER